MIANMSSVCVIHAGRGPPSESILNHTWTEKAIVSLFIITITVMIRCLRQWVLFEIYADERYSLFKKFRMNAYKIVFLIWNQMVSRITIELNYFKWLFNYNFNLSSKIIACFIHVWGLLIRSKFWGNFICDFIFL